MLKIFNFLLDATVNKMSDETCKYFKEITSLVPYVHKEKVCSEKLPFNKEIYDFSSYRCKCDNSSDCDLIKKINKSE